MGIEKVIGNRWKAMTAEEKEKHIDKARVEQARLIAEVAFRNSRGRDDRRSKRRTRRVIPCPSVDVDDRRKRLGCRSVNLRRRTDKGTPSPRVAGSIAFGRARRASEYHHHHHHDSHQDRDPFGYNDHHNLSDLFMPFNSSSMPVVTNSQYDHHKQR